jgi:2-polyprenyl-3-methyl-5-hydroxy-6-metoxy-1,4-benzoquinol methylase
MDDNRVKRLRNEQLDYYNARAHEYDEWLLRRGRYDRGKRLNDMWHSEVKQVRRTLNEVMPRGDILDIACGTGIWSEVLSVHADSLTVIDASEEMLAICRKRLKDDSVSYLHDDIFEWTPDRKYDFIFLGFWLSHVPPALFTGFWESVKSALSDCGRVFLVDSLRNPESTARDHQLPDDQTETVNRKLNDGREYEIVKVFYDPDDLADALSRIGFQIEVQKTEHFFIYGCGYSDRLIAR